MPKESLKDKLDGNNLDLSLSSLSEIPVKDLAALPKATRLDLSSNLLTSIPDDFCKLTHIVRLDLSQNQLTQLPQNIGSMTRLQHLDLYNNQLSSLPLSFCYFKTLKWLDLKGNPLVEPLKSVAGDCLDEIQCQNCARKVVAFMKDMQSEQERRRQKQLKEERELEAVRKMAEDKEKERQKEEKKAAKEQRRREYDAQQAGLRQRNVQKEKKEVSTDEHAKTVPDVQSEPEEEKQGGVTWATIISALLLILLIVGTGVYIHCDLNEHRQFCIDGRRALDSFYHKLAALKERYTK